MKFTETDTRIGNTFSTSWSTIEASTNNLSDAERQRLAESNQQLLNQLNLNQNNGSRNQIQRDEKGNRI